MSLKIVSRAAFGRAVDEWRCYNAGSTGSVFALWGWSGDTTVASLRAAGGRFGAGPGPGTASDPAYASRRSLGVFRNSRIKESTGTVSGATEWNAYCISSQNGEECIAAGGDACKEVIRLAVENQKNHGKAGWSIEYRQEPAGTFWRHRQQEIAAERISRGLPAYPLRGYLAWEEDTLLFYLLRSPTAAPPGANLREIATPLDLLCYLDARLHPRKFGPVPLWARQRVGKARRSRPTILVLPDGTRLPLREIPDTPGKNPPHLTEADLPAEALALIDQGGDPEEPPITARAPLELTPLPPAPE